MEVIPAILEKEWVEIEKKIQIAKVFAKTIHIDVIDGRFANNRTFVDAEPFKKFSKDVFLEAHLMVEEPINYLRPFGEAGFKRFLGHVEKMSDQERFLEDAKMYGQVGFALDAKSPLDLITISYDDIDALLIMTINAGFAKQPLMPDMLDKVRIARAKSPNPIEVDGGINDKTILLTKVAGATRFCVNSYLFNSPNPAETYRLLQSKLIQSDS